MKLIYDKLFIDMQTFSLSKYIEQYSEYGKQFSEQMNHNVEETNPKIKQQDNSTTFVSNDSVCSFNHKDNVNFEPIFKIRKIKDRAQEKRLMKLKQRAILYHRGSKYRGVSKNGGKWQVLIMINRQKTYFGKYDKEEDAAKAYDEIAIKFHGDKARTNFVHDGYIHIQN
jgi:hypothetical protein